MMHWYLSDQCDPRGIRLANRHYSRVRLGMHGFMPPGRMLVLLTEHGDAVWGTSWPYAHLLQRSWFPTAWMCSIYRNESPYLSSELILEAIAATRWYWPLTPIDGMVTIIDQRKVKSANPGYCYKKAGFKHVGYTKKGLVIVQMLPKDMPEPAMPNGAQLSLFESEVA